ncbi:hypothetical protein [Acidiferrobacter sp.]|uniref:hypothetical protein n=1 Tax=Acidiferrobacter sp. TaxID=1872107 RepID=UPI0026367CFB|nr:hypothetical protein [Acidiferrobacter sp.]
MGPDIHLLAGANFRVRHADPQELAARLDADPGFQELGLLVRAVGLALCRVPDPDAHELAIIVGRMLWNQPQASNTAVIKDDRALAGLTVRIAPVLSRIRALLIREGLDAEEESGLILFASSDTERQPHEKPPSASREFAKVGA